MIFLLSGKETIIILWIYYFLSSPYYFSLQEQLNKSYLRIPGSLAARVVFWEGEMRGTKPVGKERNKSLTYWITALATGLLHKTDQELKFC